MTPFNLVQDLFFSFSKPTHNPDSPPFKLFLPSNTFSQTAIKGFDFKI